MTSSNVKNILGFLILSSLSQSVAAYSDTKLVINSLAKRAVNRCLPVSK